ncbi:MAG TPA: alpha/beta fold hydrolase [Streptomyces sp.]
MSTEARNVVLVHGGFVDGSSWKGVYDLLSADGYTVTVVQNPALSLDDDVAATKLVLDAQDGLTVLVGHSYGGAVNSEAGNHEKASALVYIAAFAPDKDESVNTLIADPPPGAPVPPILPPREGFLFLDREKFAVSFHRRPAHRRGAVTRRLPSALGSGRIRRHFSWRDLAAVWGDDCCACRADGAGRTVDVVPAGGIAGAGPASGWRAPAARGP